MVAELAGETVEMTVEMTVVMSVAKMAVMLVDESGQMKVETTVEMLVHQ